MCIASLNLRDYLGKQFILPVVRNEQDYDF
jgi:hypothetical protein